jgi:hypothetical protein
MAKKNLEPKVETPKVETPKVETPKVETPKVEEKQKVEEKLFAGKRVLREYEQDGGKFVVLESGETIKL